MKIHTPIFVLGLLVFITRFLGLTSRIEMFVFAAYGIIIMIMSFKINHLSVANLPDDTYEEENIDEKMEAIHDDNDVVDDNNEEPTYEELTKKVQESTEEINQTLEENDFIQEEINEEN